MLNKFKNSFAFRSASAYKFLLTIFPILSKPKKAETELRLLTLTGKNQLNLFQECLFSIYKNSDKLPKVIIVTDGSIKKSEILSKLKWYNNSLEIVEKEECIKYHSENENPELSSYASKSAFGLKLAAIVQCLENKEILFCDTDVLWYKNILDVTEKNKKQNPTETSFDIKMTVDYQMCYDSNILQKFFPALINPPYYNSGVLYVRGDIFNKFDMKAIINEAVFQSNHFTEQTILAGINFQTCKNVWDKNEIVAFQHDSLSIKPTYVEKKWLARHYVGPVRHLFWRDAFFLRIGYKK